MILINYGEIINGIAKVTREHHMPFDAEHGVPQEEVDAGFLLEKLPCAEKNVGKMPVMYCNPSTKEIFYEYLDVPKSEVEVMQEKISLMQHALDELLLGGAI